MAAKSLVVFICLLAFSSFAAAQNYGDILAVAEQTIPQLLTTVPNVITTTLNNVLKTLNAAEQSLVQELISTIDGLINDLEKTLNDLLTNLGSILGTVDGVVGGVVNDTTGILTTVTNTTGGLLGGVVNTTGGLLGGILGGGNGGGLLSGLLGGGSLLRKKRDLLNLSSILGQLGGLLALPQNLLAPILSTLGQVTSVLNVFSLVNGNLFQQIAFLPLELVNVVWGVVQDLLSIQLQLNILPAIQLLNLSAQANLLTALQAEVQANASIGAILGPFINSTLAPILGNAALSPVEQLAQIYAAIQLNLFANNADLISALVNIQLPGVLSLGLFLDVGKVFYIIENLPADLTQLLSAAQSLNVSALSADAQQIVGNFTAQLQGIVNGGADVTAILSALNGAVTAAVAADASVLPLIGGLLVTVEGVVVTVYDLVIAGVVNGALGQILALVPALPIVGGAGGLLGGLLGGLPLLSLLGL